jgi:hypothetical protein
MVLNEDINPGHQTILGRYIGGVIPCGFRRIIEVITVGNSDGYLEGKI